MPTRTLRDATITLYDGTLPTPNSITLTGDGELSFAIQKRNSLVARRGVMHRFADGGQVPIPVRFALQYTALSFGGSPLTPYEALTKTGGGASWATTAEQGDVHTVKIKVVITNPLGASVETITFAYFRMDRIEFAEGEAGNMLFVSGTDLEAQPTITFA